MATSPRSMFPGREVYAASFGTPTSVDVSTDPSSFRTITNTNVGFTATLDPTQGALRLLMPSAVTAGGFADAMSIQLTRVPPLASVEILAKVWLPASVGDQYGFIGVRSDGVTLGGLDNNAYGFQFGSSSNALNLASQVNGVFTGLVGAAGTTELVANWVRLVAKGSLFMAWVWLDGAPEPTDYLWRVRDETIQRPGYVCIGLTGGNDPNTTFTIDLDEIHVWDLDAPPLGAIRR